MIDLIKDSTEAWFSRIRSPILGSIALAFVAFNWEPLWYLVFAEQPVVIKFRFFDLNTTWLSLYVGPVLAGLTIAIVSPWISLGGSYIASNPVRRSRRLQSSEASLQRRMQLQDAIDEEQLKAKLEEARAKTEAERDNRAIDAAKRFEEAESIEGSDVAGKILEERSTSDPFAELSIPQIEEELSDRERAVVAAMGQYGEEVQSWRLEGAKNIFETELGAVIENLNGIRMRVELEASLAELKKLGLAKVSGSGDWTLTSAGYEVYDLLRMR